MTRTWATLLLFAFAFASARPVAAADPTTPIADFEDPRCLDAITVGHASVEQVAAPPGGGHALKWIVEQSDRSSWVRIPLASAPDLAKTPRLQFRVRLAGDRPGDLVVRLADHSGAWVGGRIRGVSTEWKTMTLDVEQAERDGRFDPAAVDHLDFVVFRSSPGAYLIDDVVLAPPVPAAAKKAKEIVADFESPESTDFVEPCRCTVARVAAKPKGQALAWTMHGGDKSSYFELYGAPGDVREFRSLRFRARADKPVTQTLSVRFETGRDDYLDGEIASLAKEWTAYELKLPEMDVEGEFDPRRVEDLSFIYFTPPDAVVEIDDVELDVAPGGWRSTDAEVLAKVFGDARAKKVGKIPTKHFLVCTDSAAAEGKFPKALEEIYEFSKKSLDLPEMDETLPVYVFQNSNLYFDFCVRFAKWTKAEAQATAGHGSGRYFATYYMEPNAPVVAHELTHSLVHRALGPHGGSWLQEGAAVYVENLWQKRSAAEQFAPAIRSGQFVPLDEFMRMAELIQGNDAKGGARTADHLYSQAGAFFEFLLRGPESACAKAAIATLCRTRKDDSEVPAFAANLFGRSLDDLQKEWLEWGAAPPKSR